ncbi:MAG: 16S rRNA (guanine(527)-N(7))-methyltransferase RsmG [Chitinophagales bacterium]|nr:16S rRNA (guanine(527)-N(7))-methyltransferase RsmG [Chitinophagales bacterium]MDW8428484.1 16S rRNA (guanine(527)-N(7))-methyltransferase RsmG [Chitinophagales bacterium]
MELLLKYFSDLSEQQRTQFRQLAPFYEYWNARINVISRADIKHFYERHVLHSLAIACFVRFRAGTCVLDAGTGGGFPGIPLAIFFPHVHFTLVDSIGKKIKVVEAAVNHLHLPNVTPVHSRVEKLKGTFDFVTTRAVAELAQIIRWTKHLVKCESENDVASGWLMLKGGNLQQEISRSPFPVTVVPLSRFFEETFFHEKYLLHVPVKRS